MSSLFAQQLVKTAVTAPRFVCCAGWRILYYTIVGIQLKIALSYTVCVPTLIIMFCLNEQYTQLLLDFMDDFAVLEIY